MTNKHIDVELVIERSGREPSKDTCPGCGGPIDYVSPIEVATSATRCVGTAGVEFGPMFCAGTSARKPN